MESSGDIARHRNLPEATTGEPDRGKVYIWLTSVRPLSGQNLPRASTRTGKCRGAGRAPNVQFTSQSLTFDHRTSEVGTFLSSPSMRTYYKILN